MKIAVLPGDGIGPEIVAQAVKVMKALSSDGLKLEMEEVPICSLHGRPSCSLRRNCLFMDHEYHILRGIKLRCGI